MIKICERCHKSIKDDEEYTSYMPDLATAAAPNVVTHVRPCTRPPTQTAPVPLRS